MSVNTTEVLKELQKVKASIDNLFYLTNRNKGTYTEFDELVEYEDSADGRMYRDEYRRLLERLDDVKRDIEYLERPITETGTLRMNSRNYYEAISDNGRELKEYHCGSGIEALIYDEYDECEVWVASRVEHTDGRYYIVGHMKVDMDGLKVRMRG